MLLLLLTFSFAPLVAVVSHSPLSRHYRRIQQNTTSLPHIVVVAADGRGTTTGGPYAFSRDIYANEGNLLAAAHGRSAVVDGIPLNLTIVVYAVDGNDVVAPLKDAQVYLWQADAIGYYSYVEGLNTAGETWLRAKATSDVDGKAFFSTILPGWYPGRAVHWHFRVQLPGQEDSFYVTSQLFVTNDFLNNYKDFGVYAENQGRLIRNENDGIFRSIDSDIASMLTLTFDGDNDNGYSGTFHIGIDASDAGISTTTTTTTEEPTTLADNEEVGSISGVLPRIPPILSLSMDLSIILPVALISTATLWW